MLLNLTASKYGIEVKSSHQHAPQLNNKDILLVHGGV